MLIEFESSGYVSRYRELSAAAYSLDAYRAESVGERMVPVFLDMARPRLFAENLHDSDSVLDAGCGTGRGAMALYTAGFHVDVVRGCDLVDVLDDDARQFEFARANLWASPMSQSSIGPVDWVYCCDVLEHIPEAFTMLAVRNLLSIARKGVFLTMSTGPDVHGVWIGEPLHQTVKPFTWWRKHLGAVGDMLQARDLLDHGAFLVTRC